ncbi:hypothetical protein BC629DRAFT_1547970 [Irpex lacteus]|nr:hypothetical protein BC629DRAFT_1547970 [Irpex lacteus]
MALHQPLSRHQVHFPSLERWFNVYVLAACDCASQHVLQIRKVVKNRHLKRPLCLQAARFT